MNGDDNIDEARGEKSLGIYKVVLKVDREIREIGRHKRVTSNHSRNTRRPSEAVASCGGPEPRDGRRDTGSGRAEERRGSPTNPRIIVDARRKRGRLGQKAKKT